MPDYTTTAINHLRDFLPEHAIVDAVLGVAYEQRTANLLALNHLLEPMLQNGTLDADGTELLTNVSTQILERLDLEKTGTE
jgi:hypothetical protein